MTAFDHEEGEMRRLPLSEGSVDALLDGRIVAEDAPPGYQHVARLIGAARSPASADELAGEHEAVATLAAAVGEAKGVSGAIHEGRRPVLTRLLTVKMAAAAAAVVLGGGAAAAATGSLPPSLQAGLSHGLSAVGISVPDPSTQPSGQTLSSASTSGSSGTTTTGSTGTTTTGSTGTTTSGSTGTTTSTTSGTTSVTATTAPTQAVGPSASGPAAYGLCTAYAASSGSQAGGHSVAFRNLAAAAKTQNESVTQYCATVPKPSTAHPGRGMPKTGAPVSTSTASVDLSGTHASSTGGDHPTAGAGNGSASPSQTHRHSTASTRPVSNVHGGGSSSTAPGSSGAAGGHGQSGR